MALHGFTAEGAQRIVNVVRRVEGQNFDGRTTPQPKPVPRGQGGFTQWVLVTSATQQDGRHPGTWSAYDVETAAWTEMGDCWVVDANGETLSVQRYQCRLQGTLAADNLPVFVTGDQAAAAASVSTPAFVRITSSTAVTGALYPGLLQSYTVAGGYADTATAVRVIFPNSEVPGLARVAAVNSGETSGGEPVYQSLERPLTVAATDAGTGDTNATYYGISTLNINQGTGLALTNSSLSCKVAAQDASGTHSGVVNLSDQTLGGGDKTFNSDVAVQAGLTVNSNGEVTTGQVFRVFNAGGATMLRCDIIAGANCTFVNCDDDAIGTAPALEVSGNIKGTTINATSAFQANGTSGTNTDYTDGVSTAVQFTGGIAVGVT